MAYIEREPESDSYGNFWVRIEGSRGMVKLLSDAMIGGLRDDFRKEDALCREIADVLDRGVKRDSNS